MIKPIAAEPKILIKKVEKPVVKFFSKSPPPFSTAEKGETTNSLLFGAAIFASTMYMYKKYRRAKIAKGEKLNPTIDKTAKSLNKKINTFVYNTSKIFEKKGFKKFANAMKVLIFKI